MWGVPRLDRARRAVGAVTFASPSAVIELDERSERDDFARLLADARAGGDRPHDRARARRSSGVHSGGCRERDAREPGVDRAANAADDSLIYPQELPQHGIPDRETAPHPAVRRLAAHGARDASRARPAHLPAVRRPGTRRAPPGREHAGHQSAVGRRGGQGSQRRPHGAGVPAVLVFAAPTEKDARASAALRPPRTRRAGRRRHQGRLPRAARVGRRVPVRSDRPRPLRTRTPQGRDRQRLLHRRRSPRWRSTTRAPAPMRSRRAT